LRLFGKMNHVSKVKKITVTADDWMTELCKLVRVIRYTEQSQNFNCCCFRTMAVVYRGVLSR